MTEPVLPRHGLEPVIGTLPQAAGEADLVLAVVADCAHINLRGAVGSPDFVATVETALGQQLPRTPNRFTLGPQRIFWLGFDEWLIVTSAAALPMVFKRLREALSGLHACVTDVSGGQVCLILSGAKSTDLLAKGCTLDFHPRAFPAGTCAQSGLARANVLIAHHNEPADTGGPGLEALAHRGSSVFEIVVRRSFAEYVVLWLHHAGKEFGIRFQAHQVGQASS